MKFKESLMTMQNEFGDIPPNQATMAFSKIKHENHSDIFPDIPVEYQPPIPT
jgi:hypothetical protein